MTSQGKKLSLSICRRIREESTIPIVVMASAGDEARVVLALEMGANDYLTRPLDVDAVMARVRTALIRSSEKRDLRDTPLEVGPLVFQLARRQVRVRGKLVHFPRREYDLLLALVLRPGHIRTRTELIAEIWGHTLESSKTLDAHIMRIRKKSKPTPDILVTSSPCEALGSTSIPPKTRSRTCRRNQQ